MARLFGSRSELSEIRYRINGNEATLKPNSSTASTAATTFELPGQDNGTFTLLTASSTATLTNKTFDIDGTGNSLSNIADANIKAAAAITRSKLASGSANHVIINDGSGVLSSETFLGKSRGGAGADMSSVTFPSSGTLVTEAGTQTLTNKTNSAPIHTGNTLFDEGAELRFDELAANGSSFVGFKAPSDITNPSVTWTLPDGDGTANQVLQTSGTGTLSWATVATAGLNEDHVLIGDATNTQAAVDTGALGHIEATTTNGLRLKDTMSITGGARKFRISASGAFPTISANTVAAFVNTQAASDDVNISLISGNTGTSTINFGDTDTEDPAVLRYQHSSNQFEWGVNNSGIKMTLNSSGQLGIGVTSPSATLDVKSSGTNTNVLLLQKSSSTASTHVFREDASGHGELFIRDTSSNNVIDLSADPSSVTAILNPGSITLPSIAADTVMVLADSVSPRLSIIGSTTGSSRISFGDTATESRGIINYDHTTDALSFAAGGGSTALDIGSSGDVGIGVAGSSVKLEVREAGVATGGDVANFRFNTALNNDALANCVNSVDSSGSSRSAIGFSNTGSLNTGYWFAKGGNTGSNAWYYHRTGILYAVTNSNDIGGTTGTAVVVGTQPSDERIKTSIVNSTYGLTEILALTPKKYTKDERTELGFLSSDVKALIPEAVQVTTQDFIDKNDQAATNLEYLHYHQLIPVLIKAVQELEARVAALEV